MPPNVRAVVNEKEPFPTSRNADSESVDPVMAVYNPIKQILHILIFGLDSTVLTLTLLRKCCKIRASRLLKTEMPTSEA